MTALTDYLRLVKFSHTIFAMPFALIAFVYAWKTCDTSSLSLPILLMQVVGCMVFARNVAMGFNREIPAGVISPRAALWFVGANALLFIVLAATINPLTGWLSPVALAVLMFYSYCKRFTALAHLVLGLSLGIAPVGAYLAVAGSFAVEPCILTLLVMTWCGGFDIIYALQDAEFDRRHSLHSIPARFSARTSLAISIALHAASIAALLLFASYLPQRWPLYAGCAVFTAIIVMEHIIVTPTSQRNIGIAFGTLNGLASTTLAIFLIADMSI